MDNKRKTILLSRLLDFADIYLYKPYLAENKETVCIMLIKPASDFSAVERHRITLWLVRVAEDLDLVPTFLEVEEKNRCIYQFSEDYSQRYKNLTLAISLHPFILFIRNCNTNVFFCHCGFAEVEPLSVWLCTFLRLDFYAIAIVENCRDGHKFSIYFGTCYCVSNIRVDAICKVDSGRTEWQVNDVSFWSKDKNSFVEEIIFNIIEKSFVIILFLIFDEIFDPARNIIEVYRRFRTLFATDLSGIFGNTLRQNSFDPIEIWV